MWNLFRCDRCYRKRRKLEISIGDDMEPEIIVGRLIEGKDKWNTIQVFVNSIK